MQEVKLGEFWHAELIGIMAVHLLVNTCGNCQTWSCTNFLTILATDLCKRSNYVRVKGVLGFGDGYNSFRLGTPPQIQECKFSHGIFIYFPNEKYSFRSIIYHALIEDVLFV